MKKLLMALAVAASACALFGEQYSDGERVWTMSRSTAWVSQERIDYWSVTDVTPKPEGKLEIPYRLGDFNIVGIGKDAFANASNLTEVVVGDGVKYIAANAFKNCVKLDDITLPSGMSWIDCDAFSGTKAEENDAGSGFQVGEYFIKYTGDKSTFSVPDDVKMICDYAFCYYATNSTGEYTLKKVKIPEGVETIGDGAFCAYEDCALETIKLPDSVTSVGDWAFANCWNLKTLELGAGIKRIGEKIQYTYVDEECELQEVIYWDYYINDWFGYDEDGECFGNNVETLVLGDGVVEIPEGTFNDTGWNRLNTVEFGEALTCISASAFEGCSNLSNVNFKTAASLSGMGEGAFAGSAVTEVDLSECTQLAELPDDAFSGCANLEKVVFNEGLKSIGWGAFYDCDKLEKVEFPDSLKRIGTHVEDLEDLDEDVYGAFEDCNSLKTVDFNEGLETIGDASFCCCPALEKLEFPDSLKTIGHNAFQCCDALSKVEFNEGLETIGDAAFEGYNAIDKLEFPASLKIIGYEAFLDCKNVTSVTFAEDSALERLGECAFENLVKLDKIEIPASVTTIEGYLFEGCEKLEKVTGGDGVTECFADMFGDCPFATFGEFDDEGKELKNEIVTFGKVVIGLRGKCPKSIDAEDFGEEIVQIAPDVFSWWKNYSVSNLTSVTFPETLVEIGSGAFYYATNLKDVTFGENTEALVIGDSAFAKTGIRELEGTFRSIGWGAFECCLKLESVAVTVQAEKFANELDPDEWEYEGGFVDGHAFAGCTNLVSADVTARGVSIQYGDCEAYTAGGRIGKGSFAGCEKLAEVRLSCDDWLSSTPFGEYEIFFMTPDWEYIDRYAYTEALEEIELDAPYVPCGFAPEQAKLEKVTLGEKIWGIGASAFAGCEKLSEIAIPAKTTFIGESAFAGCTGLKDVTGCDAVEIVDPYAFEGTEFITGAKRGPLQVGCVLFRWVDDKEGETAEIDSSVKTIACNAFTSNQVAKVVVPEGVELIHDGVFRDCPQLQVVEFKNPDVNLGLGAAANCPQVTWIASKGGFIFQGFYGSAVYDEYILNLYGDYTYPSGRSDFKVRVARFEKVRFHNDPNEDGQFVEGSTYVGWIMRDGVVVGSITVKTGKRDANGKSKVRATVQLPGSKKSYTSLFEVDPETGKAYSADGYYSDLYGMILGGKWMSGTVNFAGANYTVRGGSDVSNTTAFDSYAGHVWAAAFVAAGEGVHADDCYTALCNGYSSIVVTPAKKGKIKVTGLLADGTKVSTTAQMVAGDHGMVAAPVTLQLYKGKKGGFSFLLQFYMDNGKPRMYFDDSSADGSIGIWRYQLPDHWKPFADVGVWVGDVGEIDVNGAGFKAAKAQVALGGDDSSYEALCRATKGELVGVYRYDEYGITFDADFVDVEVDAAKGKWALPKAGKLSLLTKPEAYAAFIADENNWNGNFADDGKYLQPYWGTFGSDTPTCCDLNVWTPTHWLVYDLGSKLDKKSGQVTLGANTNEGAWKLSYAKKSGQFSGSKQYFWVDMSKAEKHALKKGKATVGGVVIDGTAYGTAAVKGVCSFAVYGESRE